MKISIITTSFNSGATIRDTLESVLAQSYHDYEHIIVDGNSSDDTMEIVKSYLPRYNGRLMFISEPDKGIYDAMNKGIQMATGDIVGVLNSDDFFTSNRILGRVNKEFKNKKIEAIYGDIHYAKEDDLKKTVRYYSSRWFHRLFMLSGYQPAHPSFYCRRKLFDKYGLYDTTLKIASDFELLFRFLYIHKIKTKYVPLDFVTMRMGGISTQGISSHKQILREHYITYKKHHIITGYVLDFFRYPLKIGETILTKKYR